MSRGALAVIDTNVLVAGLLTRAASSPTARIVDLMLSGELRFAISVELLTEYRSVLLRPKVQQRHGLDANEVDVILGEIARNAVVGSPRRSEQHSTDPGDQHLWDLLEGLGHGVLVTGDRGALAAGSTFRVLTPADFLRTG